MIVSTQDALQYHDEVWPLDINGEPFYDTDPVFNFANIQNVEKLLIKLRQGFCVTGPLDLEVVLYLEKENHHALKTTLRVSCILYNANRNVLKGILLKFDF